MSFGSKGTGTRQTIVSVYQIIEEVERWIFHWDYVCVNRHTAQPQPKRR